MRPGDAITLVDQDCAEHDLRLQRVSADAVVATVIARVANASEPAIRVDLYQALVPREKLETVIQKATEVGAHSIVPFWCERSLVRRRNDLFAKQLERWRRIAREAAEQSRRGQVPLIAPPMTFEAAIASATAGGPAVLAWEGERVNSIRAALSVALQDHSRPLSLLIGPEGGFSSAEAAFARAAGVTVASLGPRILRTETAGPIVVALALFVADEMAPR